MSIQREASVLFALPGCQVDLLYYAVDVLAVDVKEIGRVRVVHFPLRVFLVEYFGSRLPLILTSTVKVVYAVTELVGLGLVVFLFALLNVFFDCVINEVVHLDHLTISIVVHC